jgi:sec-independent protein translocase protein TatB
MEVLGVGPLELFFILIIALVFLGPRDMVNAGRTMGKYMRKIVMSPTWRMVQQTSREIRTLPNKLIREAGLEEDVKELDQLRKDVGNQIGSMRKPFSATASEVNKDIQEVQASLKAPVPPAASVVPPVQDGLAAWTTPPPTSKPAEEAMEGSSPDAANEIHAVQASETSDITPDDVPAMTENPNPDEP